MTTTSTELYAQTKVVQLKWQRIILLVVLGYEAAGCLLGGIFLIVSPDGSLMDMPVGIMHDVFKDFLIPGIILFWIGHPEYSRIYFGSSQNVLRLVYVWSRFRRAVGLVRC